jgi:drug/metabolite transporter (DMT)-like permease
MDGARAAVTGRAAAAAALFLIGTSAPFAATLAAYPLLGGQAVRFAVAAALLLALLRCRPAETSVRITRNDVLGLAALGLVGIAGFNVFLVAATRQADPALVGTVLAATPLALGVLDPVLRRRRPSPFVVTGCAVVTAGTVLGAGFGSTSALGSLLCVGALVCEVAFALLAVPLIGRLGTVRTTAYAVVAAAVQLAIAGLLVDGPAGVLRAPTGTELISLLYLAVVIAVLANLLWYAALPRIGADHAGLFYAFTPVGALTVGVLLHTSSPTGAELTSIAVVIVGLLVGLGVGRRAPSTDACSSGSTSTSRIPRSSAR